METQTQGKEQEQEQQSLHSLRDMHRHSGTNAQIRLTQSQKRRLAREECWNQGNNAHWGSLLRQTLGLAELPGTRGTGFPGGSDSKESACNSRDLGFISGSGRFPGEENSYSLQYSCLENSMDRGAWRATIHGVAKSVTTERLTHTEMKGQERGFPTPQQPRFLLNTKTIRFERKYAAR